MALRLKIGCCGFAVKGGMRAYFQQFGLVELQSTFYRLPRLETAKRWREEAPAGFEFTMKAFQGVTHPPTSPTWRKVGFKPQPSEASKIGLLRPTEENFQFWEETRLVSEALAAKVIIIQCPPAFACSEGAALDMRGFFNSIRRGGLLLALELRNPSWTPERVKELCDELLLIHVVDPFRQRTVTADAGVVYYRLHGLGKRPYSYSYTDEDLRRLYAEHAKPFYDAGKEVYVLWNNVTMAKDAKRFTELYLRE